MHLAMATLGAGPVHMLGNASPFTCLRTAWSAGLVSDADARFPDWGSSLVLLMAACGSAVWVGSLAPVCSPPGQLSTGALFIFVRPSRGGSRPAGNSRDF